MGKVGKHYRIYNALLADENDQQRFMSLTDLAVSIYGEVFYDLKKSHRRELEKQIKQAIHITKELAKQNGRIIISKRKPTEHDPEKKFMAIGWKIANGKSDAQYLLDEMELRTNLQNAHENKKLEYQDFAIQKGIMALNGKNQLKLIE